MSIILFTVRKHPVSSVPKHKKKHTHNNTYLELVLLPLLHTHIVIDGFLLKEVETVIYRCFLCSLQ